MSSHSEHKWYILCASYPLVAKERCLQLVEPYEEKHASHLDITLRTPYDILSPDESRTHSKSSGFQCSYIFARADLRQLDLFMYYCRSQNVDIKILNRRIDANGKLTASTISEPDMMRFIHFCEGYILLHKDSNIPFLDLNPDAVSEDDSVTFNTDGYQGLEAFISKDQQGVADDRIRVHYYWFGCIAVPVELPKSDMVRHTKEQYHNDRYAQYHEYFDYILLPVNLRRWQERQFIQTDYAKAIRMQRMATPTGPVTHSNKESRFVRLIKTTALAFATFVLDDHHTLQTHLDMWHTLFVGLENKKDSTKLKNIISIIA